MLSLQQLSIHVHRLNPDFKIPLTEHQQEQIQGQERLTFGNWDQVCYGFRTQGTRAVSLRTSPDTQSNSFLVACIDGSRIRSNQLIKTHCTCTHFQETSFCEHILLLIHKDLPEAQLETDPFLIAESAPLLTNDVLNYLLTPGSPRTNNWQTCMELLKRRPVTIQEPKSAAVQNARRIWLQIDREHSEKTGYLVLRSMHTNRLKDGSQGTLKPFNFNILALDDLPEPLRIPFQLMEEVESENPHDKRPAYIVPSPFVDHVLPALSEHGSLTWLPPGEHDPKQGRLTWNPEPLSVALAMKQLGTSALVHCTLKNRQSSFSQSQCDLILSQGLVLVEGQIHRIANPEQLRWLDAFNSEIPLLVAEDDLNSFFDALSQRRNLPYLEMGPELGFQKRDLDPTPHIQILAAKRDRQRYHPVRVRFHYGFQHQVEPSHPGDTFLDHDHKMFIHRKRDAERNWLEQLRQHQLHPLAGTRTTAYKINQEDLFRTVHSLINSGWRVDLQGKQVRRGQLGQFKVRSGIDWFDLNMDLDFEGENVPITAVLKQIRRNKDFVLLSDGSHGIIDPQWSNKLRSFLHFSNQEDEEHLRFQPSQALILDRLLDEMSQDQPTQLELDHQFQSFRNRIQNLSNPEPADPPPGFKGTLRPYQREGLGWLLFLRELGINGCLADDMGLGKTVQVLALLQTRQEQAKRPSLVVVPKSLVQNWVMECERFVPRLSVLCYEGTRRQHLRDQIPQHDLVVMTYGIMRRDILELKELAWDYVILDESQAIKNHLTQSTKAARLLLARHKLALTGTPIENHVGELWSQFEFLNPGILGHSSLFKILKSKKGQLSPEEHQTIAKGLRPFILRRTKKQVLHDLPLKTEQTILCSMNQAQSRFYKKLKRSIHHDISTQIESKGMASSKIQILEALLRLRQAACHPALLGYQDEESIKFQILIEHLKEIIAEGHKALIFSQFTQLLGLLKRDVFEQGWAFEYLDGKSRRRQESIRRFQEDPNVPLFLISLKAGGLGLNLTAADYVYILDPWWNPAVENQAIDRAHRIGQTKRVFAYRLIVQDTVEDKILKLQARKRDLAEALITENNSLISDMSQEDLELLFS